MQTPSYTRRTLGRDFTKGYQCFLGLFTVTSIQSIRKVQKQKLRNKVWKATEKSRLKQIKREREKLS